MMIEFFETFDARFMAELSRTVNGANGIDRILGEPEPTTIASQSVLENFRSATTSG